MSRTAINLLRIVGVLVTVTMATYACSKKSNDPAPPRTVTVTAAEHHLGDNPSAEGSEYNATFDITGSFTSATCALTFVYPNAAGQSGPEIDSPPEIYINGTKVGLAASDFPDIPACINAYREYECDVTLSVSATGAVIAGTNTIRVVAMGAAHAGDDDFVFKDLTVTVR